MNINFECLPGLPEIFDPTRAADALHDAIANENRSILDGCKFF
jgi:hypothetical protein